MLEKQQPIVSVYEGAPKVLNEKLVVLKPVHSISVNELHPVNASPYAVIWRGIEIDVNLLQSWKVR